MGSWKCGTLLFLLGTTIVSGRIISSLSKEPCDDHSAKGFQPINQFQSGQAFIAALSVAFPFPLHPEGTPYLSSHQSKPVNYEDLKGQNHQFVIPMINMWPIIPMSQVPINYFPLQEKPCADHAIHTINNPFIMNVPEASSLLEPATPDNQVTKEVTTPLIIPSAPELPPLKPIIFPKPPTISSLLTPPQSTTNDEIIDKAPAPEIFSTSESFPPPIHKEEHPEWNEIKSGPINIPDAPKLPEFVMPEIPAPTSSVVKPSNIPACTDEQKTSEIKNGGQEIAKPIIIPVAPELPAFVMTPMPDIHVDSKKFNPEFTEDTQKKVPSAIPKIPNWQPLILPSVPTPIVDKDSSVNEVYENIIPTHIPEAPVLPQFVMPAIPSIHEANSHVETPEAPEVYNNKIHEVHRPISIPVAPELPPFVVPTMPDILVDSKESIPEFTEDTHKHVSSVIAQIPNWQPLTLPSEPTPIVVKDSSVNEVYENIIPTHIPEAPVLPQFVMPAIPSIHEANSHVETPEAPEVYNNKIHEVHRPISIPVAPELPPFVVPPMPDIHVDSKESIPEFTEDTHKHVPSVIAQIPNWQPLTLPSEPTPIVVKDSSVNEVYENIIPTHIPEAPVLPQIVMPAIPSIHEANSHVETPEAPEVYTNEIHEVHRPINIPAAPELPPFVMPPMPDILVDSKESIPEFTEDTHKHVSSVIAQIPNWQPLTLPSEPTPIVVKDSSVNEVYENIIPTHIPEAPVLPQIVMPAIPSIHEANSHVETPEAPEVYTNEIHEVHRPISIPVAPELPPFVMPPMSDIHVGSKESIQEFTEDTHKHVPSVIAQIPNWQPLTLPSEPTPIVVKDSSVNEVYENIIPTHVPEAPVLPQFVMPAIPTVHAAKPNAETPDVPEVYTNEIHQGHRPIDIPAAPELPAFLMPELPVIKEKKNESPFKDDLGSLVLPTLLPPSLILPEHPAKITGQEPSLPNSDESNKNSSPAKIPQAPILPEFSMPLIPQTLPTFSSPEAKPSHQSLADIPNDPELPAFVMPEISQKIHSSKPLIPCYHENSKPIINFSVPNHPQLPNQFNIPHLNLNQHIAYSCACADAIVQQRLIPNLAHSDVNISNPTERHIYAFSSK